MKTTENQIKTAKGISLFLICAASAFGGVVLGENDTAAKDFNASTEIQQVQKNEDTLEVKDYYYSNEFSDTTELIVDLESGEKYVFDSDLGYFYNFENEDQTIAMSKFELAEE